MSTTRLLSAAVLLTMMLLQGVNTQGGNVALHVDEVAQFNK